jgi:hypothetical protein
VTRPGDIKDSYVDDFFALCGEGKMPACPKCECSMDYDHEKCQWVCPNCGEGDEICPPT